MAEVLLPMSPSPLASCRAPALLGLLGELLHVDVGRAGSGLVAPSRPASAPTMAGTVRAQERVMILA